MPILREFRGYTRKKLRHDLVAGATLTLVSIPQAIGFALILGLPPGEFVAVILAPLAILVATFAFTARQQALDRRHDVAEE